MNAPALETSINIVLKGETILIKFPKPGQIIGMESKKIAFSNGQFTGMAEAGTVGASLALDLVEAFAFILELVPNIRERLRVDSIFDIEMEDAMEIVAIYKSKILPWYLNWLKFLGIIPDKTPAEIALEAENKKGSPAAGE